MSSKFSLDVIREFAWQSHNEDAEWNAKNPRDRVESIRNPDGWAIAAHRSGEFDPLIEQFANEKEKQFEDKVRMAATAVELAMSLERLSVQEAMVLLRDAREFAAEFRNGAGEKFITAVVERIASEPGNEFVQTTAA